VPHPSHLPPPISHLPTDSMEPLYIPHINARRDRTIEVIVDEFIPEFETLTPVRGKVIVKHGGTFLDVSAQTETIVTLTCYRCLQQYNHRLVLNANEIIWLDPDADKPYDGPLERETDAEELIESLPPDGHFQTDVWLYEQLCLAVPQRELCNQDCAEVIADLNPAVADTDSRLDRRWGILESLKDRLP
jgi:uncharacterized protein